MVKQRPFKPLMKVRFLLGAHIFIETLTQYRKDRKGWRKMRYALLLDDDPDIRMIVGAVLTRLGYKVIAAGSVRQAKQLLSAGPAPILAVLDYNLPDGTGPQLAVLLRDSFGQGIRMISMSANMGPDGNWKPEERKLYDAVILKPFDITDLELAVANPRSP